MVLLLYCFNLLQSTKKSFEAKHSNMMGCAINVLETCEMIDDHLSQFPNPDADDFVVSQRMLSKLHAAVELVKANMADFELRIRQLEGTDKQEAQQRFDVWRKLVASKECQIDMVKEECGRHIIWHILDDKTDSTSHADYASQHKQLLVKFFQGSKDADNLADQVMNLSVQYVKHRLIGVRVVYPATSPPSLELAYKMGDAFERFRLPYPSRINQ